MLFKSMKFRFTASAAMGKSEQEGKEHGVETVSMGGLLVFGPNTHIFKLS